MGKIKYWQYQMLAKIIGQQELSFIAGATATLGESWGVSVKAKRSPTMQNLLVIVYSRFIHNCHNIEATQWSSVSEWISQLQSIHSMEYLFNNGKRCVVKLQKTQENLKCKLLSEQWQSEKALYYKIPIIDIPENT